ncbi:MAG: tetratricopeptide repeat protein, partial [Candidatus Acidiferrales bacterium]
NQKVYGGDSPAVADCLRLLASLYVRHQDYTTAQTYLLHAVQIDEATYGRDGFGVSLPLWFLCDLYEKWNKPELAEPRYRQMIAIIEKQYGTDSPMLLTTLTTEAKTLRKLGREKEAEAVDQRSVSIRSTAGKTEGAAAMPHP